MLLKDIILCLACKNGSAANGDSNITAIVSSGISDINRTSRPSTSVYNGDHFSACVETKMVGSIPYIFVQSTNHDKISEKIPNP